MADKKEFRLKKIIGLSDLELTNDELFVRKSLTNLDVDTKIIVDETHVAILLKNGIALETLKAGAYQVFDKKIGLKKDIKLDAFRVELFYMSKTAKVQLLWGTPSLFNVYDSTSGINVKMGANGELDVTIKNPRQFYLEVVGASKVFTVEDLKERIKGRMLSVVETEIAHFIDSNEIDLEKLSENKLNIANHIKNILNKILTREYGLQVQSFIINNINISDSDINKANIAKGGDPIVCHVCGLTLPAGSKFCNNCGAKL